MRKTGVFALAALSASSIFSATYYWKGGASGFGDYTALANWSTESLEGAAAEMLPGENDEYYQHQSLSFDLKADRAFLAADRLVLLSSTISK